MRKIWIAITLAIACYGQWPAPKSAEAAYDFVQERREAARKLFEQGDARGIQMLQETLPYLDQPLVRDFSTGSIYLAARRLNIWMDLAEAYAIQGDKQQTIGYLRRAADIDPNPQLATYLKNKKGFAKMLDDPDFVALLKRFSLYSTYWNSKAFSTPFRENLSDAEKVAGLSKFWSEVKYNFGYPERLVELDWDKLYLESIPKVLATKSTETYYGELTLLCARLADGHTNVNPPAQASPAGRVPLRTALVEGRVMIVEVMSPTLEAHGLSAGMEIVGVDGEPAVDYGRIHIEPYQSASTQQNRDIRTFYYAFLRGPADKPASLKLRDPAGKETEQTIERRGYNDVRRVPAVEWRILPDRNIAYVALNQFESDTVVKQWKELFPKIVGTSGLILDLRRNGGGDTGIGYEVLRDLAERPFLGSRQVMRSYNPTKRARGTLMEWTEEPAEEVPPNEGVRYTKPVAVLAGAETFSAAEDFLVAWKNSGRGAIVGELSGGSTGQPLPFNLPGGGSARVCTKRDTFPDGREWVGKGIEPDVVVHPSIADVQKGRDAVLEKALEYVASRH